MALLEDGKLVLQYGLAHQRRWVRGLCLLGLALLTAIPVGAIVGLLGPIMGVGLVLGLFVAYGMLRSVHVGLLALIAVICLLPFAALPINIGFSPTLLDLALLGLFFVWIGRVATRQDATFVATAPTGAVLAFALLMLVSFVAGLTHSPMTPTGVRNFFELWLSVLLFVLVINTVRTKQQVQVMVLALIAAGFVAAFIGVVLWLLPDEVMMRALSTLRVVRYPSGMDVLRYIEDDPERPLRAVSTSIDPNVLGGLLIFVSTLTVTQLAAPRPMLRRGWLAVISATMLACLILSFSRGALLGLAAALGLLGLLRYRRALLILMIIAALLLLLPPAQVYVQHLISGLRGEDLATQMRFGEYKDSLILISRHPWLGVGFLGTPEIDIYLGVSCVYLLVASNTGVVGLAAFLLALGLYLARMLRALRRAQGDPDLEPLLLGTGLAVAGAMVGGLFDHYLFNLVFPHASALLWLTVGLGTAASRLAIEESASPPAAG